MTVAGEKFVAAFGKPDPATPPGLKFSRPAREVSWKFLHPEIGSGWFMNRFLFLFGEGLDRLQPCLDAWSFLVPPGHPDRMILGRNAYGAILVLENANTPSAEERVFVLDPTMVHYWSDPNLVFPNLIGHFLPDRQIPCFLENRPYEAWLKGLGRHLEVDEILAMKEPISLGGSMEDAHNFQPEDIFEYYRTTAPIYADALQKNAAKAASKKPSKRGPKAR
jgi:hypothetical protein